GTPSPFVGEGRGGGDSTTPAFALPPTPNPSPQGGGERRSLPALRQQGPLPPRAAAGESLGDSLNAILTRPHERTDRAKEILARQPMIAAHPLVSGDMPM